MCVQDGNVEVTREVIVNDRKQRLLQGRRVINESLAKNECQMRGVAPTSPHVMGSRHGFAVPEQRTLALLTSLSVSSIIRVR